MIDWIQDKAWADSYMPEIKMILGLHLIGEAHYDDDAMRNTDLIVLTMAAVRIACRIRRLGYAEQYGNQFTIRCSRNSGNKTELAKIVEGWGDYLFYGHAGDDGKLSAWALCDLKVFRLWFNIAIVNNHGLVPGILKSNSDGSSDFRAFCFTALPESFIVSRKLYKATTQPK